MKKLCSLAIILAALLIAVQVPPAGASAEVLVIEGPAAVRTGQHITLCVQAAAGLDGVSADVATEGLLFDSVSSGMCASYGIVLLPQFGSTEVVFSYTVSAPPGGTVSFRLDNVTATAGTESTGRAPAAWAASVALDRAAEPGSPDPLETAQPGPGNSFQTETSSLPPSAAPADESVSPSPAASVMGDVEIHGPAQTFTGETVQIAVALTGGRSLETEISTSGLSFVRVASGLCTPGHLSLMTSPGLDAAVYTYRVTAPAGSTVSFTVSGSGEWHARVTEPQLVAGDGFALSQPEAGPWGGTFLVCDITVLEQGVTVAQLSAGLDYPSCWTLEVRSAAGLKGSCDRLATGDSFVFRNGEQGQVMAGRIVLRGDLTGTGCLNVAQLVRMARILCGSETSGKIVLAAGDVNGNGGVDIDDLVRMGQRLTGKTQKTRPA